MALSIEDKAKELVRRFRKYAVLNSEAKQCALICCDYVIGEILNLIGSKKHMWTENEKEIYEDWESKKQFIEKM